MEMKQSNMSTLSVKGICLGVASGAVVWCFLKVMALLTTFLWETMPAMISSPLYTVGVCTIGGLLTGLFRKRFGDLPDELMVILKKIKEDHFYDYTKLPILLVSALLPLIFASSVGPEAALVGIITSLCYWVAATLRKNAGGELSLSGKRVTYGLAIAAGLGIYVLLNEIFGAAMEAFPSFEVALPRGKDLLLSVPYILAGYLLAKYYDIVHHGCHSAAAKIPPVARETLTGFLLGIAAAFVPEIMFSGESQIHHLMTEYVEYLPWMLIGISLLKVLITNLCIQGGLKGGHFFPLIYAGVLVGYALAMLIYPDVTSTNVVFAAAVVTASMLGANMKSPMLVSLILLICFPFRMSFWLIIGACAGCALMSLGKPKEA